MKLIIESTNWLAVGVATVSYSVFSGVWHRQFAFGKKWEKAMGFKRTNQWKETNIYYIVPTISCFTTSLVISIILNLTSTSSITDAVALGSILGLGFATSVTFTNAILPIMPKPLVFAAITGTAHAIGITIATIIIFWLSGF